MASTKQVSVFVLLALFLTGCGSVARNDHSIDVSADSKELVNEQTNQIAKQPNPYWKKRRSVDESAEAMFTSALISLEIGELELARQQFTELSVEHPKLSGPWVNLGIIHYQSGEMDEAEKSWKRAIELNRLNFDAYTNLGLLKREQGQFEEAEAIYKKALKKWPDNAEMRCNLGILYDLYKGEQVLALQEYLLCEQLSDEPSRQLRGWIVDLERRTQTLVTN